MHGFFFVWSSINLNYNKYIYTGCFFYSMVRYFGNYFAEKRQERERELYVGGNRFALSFII